jgi:hypothetical protein
MGPALQKQKKQKKKQKKKQFIQQKMNLPSRHHLPCTS